MFDPRTWQPRDHDQQLEWSGSPSDIADACTRLEAVDRRAERARPRWLVLATLVGGGTFVVGMGLHIWWITLTGLGIAGVLGRQYSRASRRDVEERKISLIRTLVDAFAGELRKGMPLRVSLDLRAYWHYGPDEPWMTLWLPMADRVELEARLITTGERVENLEDDEVADRCTETLVVCLTAPEGYSLMEGDAPARRPKMGPLMLCRSTIEPRTATFVFCTDPLTYEVRDTRGLLTRFTIPRHQDIVDAVTLCRRSLVRVEAEE